MLWPVYITFVFAAFYIILMLLFSYGWVKGKTNEHINQLSIPNTKVSVIIAARNESENIEACIQSILQSSYPIHLFEIIVIDDFSTDNTFEKASQLLKNKNGKVLQLSNFMAEHERINAFKKKALSIAIEQANGELIVTTDADCIVAQNWLSEIVNCHSETGAKAIAGPVSFSPFNNKNLLYYFQSLDFMTMQGITAATHQLGFGSMSNGANFCFEKDAFKSVNGYEGINQIASGDDMLLLYKIKKVFPGKIQYLKSREAVVSTPVQGTLNDLLNQRIRWASKSGKYEDKSMTAILLLVYLVNLSLLILFFVALVFPDFFKYLIALFGLKIFAELIFLFPVAGFYNKTKELVFFPLLQPLHVLYIVIAGFLGMFGSYHWKERKVI